MVMVRVRLSSLFFVSKEQQNERDREREDNRFDTKVAIGESFREREI
jgi:hypothetical protein